MSLKFAQPALSTQSRFAGALTMLALLPVLAGTASSFAQAEELAQQQEGQQQAQQQAQQEQVSQRALQILSGQRAEGEEWVGKVELNTGRTLDIRFVLVDEGETWSGILDVPQQMAYRIPLTQIERSDKRVRFVAAIAGVPAGSQPTFQFTFEGERLVGTMQQGMMTAQASADRTAEPVKIGRGQEPDGPVSYRVSEVSIPVMVRSEVTEADGDAAAEPVGPGNSDARTRVPSETLSHKLVGTLTLPDAAQWGEGPYPGAVLLTGSGPQDRDETIAGHKPFLVLADHLTRAGIAVLRYDDRGTGASEGTFRGATMQNFAHDAKAAIAFLAEQEEVDMQRIGLIGHSEGGIVAPMVASGTEPDGVAYLVLIAGPSVKGSEVIAEQSAAMMRRQGLPEEQALSAAAGSRAMFQLLADGISGEELVTKVRQTIMESRPELQGPQIDSATMQTIGQLSDPWLKHFVLFDPAAALAQVDEPVLALFGEKDVQVLPSQNEQPTRDALQNNPDATITVLPGLNHMLQPAETGMPDEYPLIETTMDLAALNIISEWIARRFVVEP